MCDLVACVILSDILLSLCGQRPSTADPCKHRARSPRFKTDRPETVLAARQVVAYLDETPDALILDPDQPGHHCMSYANKHTPLLSTVLVRCSLDRKYQNSHPWTESELWKQPPTHMPHTCWLLRWVAA